MKIRWSHVISFVFLAAVLVMLPTGCKKKADETAAPATPAAAPQETPAMANQGNSMENPYTRENPGPWAALAEKHIPEVTYEKAGAGLKVTIKVDNHPMDPQTPHYIMSIMLHDGAGAMLGEKTFVPTDPAPVAVFELTSIPEKLIAYEHCNLHGIWKNEASVTAQ